MVGAMEKRSVKEQRKQSWIVYLPKDTPSKLVCFVEAADEQKAIACAVKEYKIPPNERDRLMTRPLHYGWLGSPR